jgi:hypothetical protein
MRDEFSRLPRLLQHQILVRFGLGMGFFVIFILLLITVRDFYLYLPCALACIFFLLTAFFLFQRIAIGEYVVISGQCTEVGMTVLKRRIKYLMLSTDDYNVKVILRSRTRKIQKGATIKLYILKNTPVYEENGIQVLCNYIALEIK